MHNIHFIVVNAKTGEDAMRFAETALLEWGGENNWRSFVAAISSKGKVVKGGDMDCGWLKNFGSLAKINQAVQNERVPDYQREAFEKVKTGKGSSMDWYVASQYCRAMSALVDISKKFNVLKDTYNDGCYDEFGVTHLAGNPRLPKWVVLMDMHS